MAIPTLAGIHHLKLPMRDLRRSADWYGEVLGYRVTVEFVEQGKLAGLGVEHPDGGPPLALRLDPALAEPPPGSTTSPSGCRTLRASPRSPPASTSSGCGTAGCTGPARAGSFRCCSTRTGTRCASTPTPATRTPRPGRTVHDPGPHMRIEPGLSGQIVGT
jgi:catechol 2,3-dioxygenase-like lactoylglutathione lyase family enzyme